MSTKPRVLCVDDEPNVLEGLALSLRRGHEVVTAGGGEAGLEILGRDPTIAAVVSDMRMPGMDGATFLGKARALAPDATRLLLTGQTELDAAITAINEGRIFRFLTKPCPPAVLVPAVEAAVEQHRLVTSERVLLEQTLRGSIKMMTEVLALAAPSVFGQAMRLQRHAKELAAKVPGAEVWPIEVAAMLSQIGFVSLPPELADKLQSGQALSPAEQQTVDRVPVTAERLISGIPRLEAVRAALRLQKTSFDGKGAAANAPRGKEVPLGARVLAVVCDFDRLEASGMTPQMAIDTMRGRRGRYDPELLEAFAGTLGGHARELDVLEIPVKMLRAGMTFLEDVRTSSGILLVARGHEATATLLERFRNLAPGSVREPVRVSVRGASGLAPGAAAGASPPGA